MFDQFTQLAKDLHQIRVTLGWCALFLMLTVILFLFSLFKPK